jgi:hypothetical protein
MSDWFKGLGMLEGLDLRCGLEVFALQLPDLLPVVRAHPESGFTIAVVGWPIDRAPMRSRAGARICKRSAAATTPVPASLLSNVFSVSRYSEEPLRPGSGSRKRRPDGGVGAVG